MSKGQVDGGADKSVGAIGPFISAAIDFGTTFSGYAFSFKHEYNKDPCQVRVSPLYIYKASTVANRLQSVITL